jgi:large subunit ribosomal protein L19
MNAITEIEKQYRKPALAAVQTGDTVRVHQLIKEGTKQRIQVFEGVVIRTHRMSELTACITVRRIASGVGVEKTFLLHSPNVSKVEILRRAKVRRNFLSFLRDRRGKSARLKEIPFDKVAANDVSHPSSDMVDAEVTEVDEAKGDDALDQAVSLDAEVKAEAKAAAADDDATVTSEADTADENTAEAEEVAEGVDKAEPNKA